MDAELAVKILPQPDDTTCGPTCLHAVYHYFGEDLDLDEVVATTPSLEDGGTLAVLLGSHALARGYRATIYSYNLHVFDPSWFGPDAPDLKDKLERQAAHKKDRKLRIATQAYLKYIAEGGVLEFEDLTASLIRRYLRKGLPVLTGLSATYLYRSPREIPGSCVELEFDDIRGEPQGHFVVLSGYNSEERLVLVADPWGPQRRKSRRYWVPMDRLVNAILLGVLTYDANLLIVEPRERKALFRAGAHRRQ